MNPPTLQRQTTQSVPNTSGTWVSDIYHDATFAWANARKCFPEFFFGDIVFTVERAGEDVFQEMERHNGEVPKTEMYRNRYVGVARRHFIDGEPLQIGDKLFTATSYDTPRIALFEICVMAIESIRTVIRHLLYSMDTPVYYNYEDAIDSIVYRGIMPTVLDNSDNVHARESSPRPVRYIACHQTYSTPACKSSPC